MSDSFQFADLLGEFVGRSGYTSGQLSKLSSIPKPTIVNWLEGRVRKPRGVEDLLLLASALHLSEKETTRLLNSAGHPSVGNLRNTAVSTSNKVLLQHLSQFEVPAAPNRHIPFQAFADIATFVGRQQELNTIYNLFTSQRTPKFVSIQGMGGVGKTALAIHIAHQMRHTFTDGVLWAKVSQSDTSAILYAFAAAYDTDVGHLSDPIIRSQAVRDLLANKNVLLILDDVESSAQIAPLLPPALKGAVIWTTRRQDLAIFNQAVQIQLQPFTAGQSESIALFTKVLGEEKVEKERPCFDQISHILGHLPLAINIAASRLAYEPGWTAQEFLDTLQQETPVIEELKFDSHDIQLSFLTSYERLDEKLKNAFQSLIIFGANDFSAQACAEIFGLPLTKMKRHLRQLHGLSLILVGNHQELSESRYLLHALIRDFLSYHDVDMYSEPFAKFYLQLVQAESNNFLRFKQEYPLLLNSLTIFEEQSSYLELTQLTNILFTYWEAIGEFQLAQIWLEKCLKYQIDNQPFLNEQVKIIFNLGRLQERLGNSIEAESYYGDALIKVRQLDLIFEHSHILRRLGVLAAQRSDFVLAEAYYKEGIQLARRINGGNPVSDFLRGLGVQAYMMGQFAKAESFYEEGLALMHLDREQIRQPYGEIGRIWGLGTVAVEQGDFEHAEKYFEMALSLAHQLGHQKRIIRLLRSIAELQKFKNELNKAKISLEKALNIAAEIGVKWQEARIAGEVGEIELAIDSSDFGESNFKRQYELARILQSPEMVGVATFGLARVNLQQNNQDMAIHYASQSLDAFLSIGHESVQVLTNWITEHHSTVT